MLCCCASWLTVKEMGVQDRQATAQCVGFYAVTACPIHTGAFGIKKQGLPGCSVGHDMEQQVASESTNLHSSHMHVHPFLL
jgi:hypothetical protein